jgi:hypothetical protein
MLNSLITLHDKVLLIVFLVLVLPYFSNEWNF